MAFDRTRLVENVSSRLVLHGYACADLAIIYEIARREKQKRRIELEPLIATGKLDKHSSEWLKTYCYAGPKRLGFERGVAESTARRAVARAKRDGLIEEVNKGYIQYRRLNVQAFFVLAQAGTPQLVYAQYKKAEWNKGSDNRLVPPLGEIDWTTYMSEADLDQNPPFLDEIWKKAADGSYKRYFGSTWERDQYLMILRSVKEAADYYRFERGLDKPGSALKSDAKMPYLLISDPTSAAALRVEGFVSQRQTTTQQASSVLGPDDQSDDDEDEYDEAA